MENNAKTMKSNETSCVVMWACAVPVLCLSCASLAPVMGMSCACLHPVCTKLRRAQRTQNFDEPKARKKLRGFQKPTKLRRIPCAQKNDDPSAHKTSTNSVHTKLRRSQCPENFDPMRTKIRRNQCTQNFHEPIKRNWEMS
jgi:hypothetical protein